MRILILGYIYPPAVNSAAELLHDLAAELTNLGHKIIVTVPDEKITDSISINREDGITVLRVKSGQIRGANKVIRAINESLLSVVIWRSAKKYFKTNPCDLIIFYSPSIFFGPLVKRLKALWECPAYLVLRDIFPQWAIDAGILRNGPVSWYFRRIELIQYKACDIIGVQSPGDIKYFTDNSRNGGKRVEVLYNWTTLDKSILEGDLRDKLGLQDKVVFVFGGNIGVAQDIDNLLRLIKAVQDCASIHFLFVGEGSELKRLRHIVDCEEYRNIDILPPVPSDQYISILNEFDVGLISLEKNLKTHNIPGKLLGYMHCSLPTLASINPNNDMKSLLEKAEAGLVCLNGEDETFREYALELAQDHKKRKRLGQNGRKLLEEKFSATNAANQILESVRGIGLSNI